MPAKLCLAQDPALTPIHPDERRSDVIRQDHDAGVLGLEHAVLESLERVEWIAPRKSKLLLDLLGDRVVDDHSIRWLLEESGRARPDLAAIGSEVGVVHVVDRYTSDLPRLEVVDAEMIVLARVRDREPELVRPRRVEHQDVLRHADHERAYRLPGRCVEA